MTKPSRFPAGIVKLREPSPRWCPQCGAPITSLGRGRAPFCTAACRIAYRDGKPITARPR